MRSDGLIIGFAGKRTSGKTTAAKVAIEKHGFEKAKFAEAFKHGLRETFDLDHRHTDGDLKEVPCDQLLGTTPRALMEWFGEGARQLCGEEIWVKRWFALHADLLLASNYVFDDVRNPNEAAAIQNAGGIVIRVLRDSADALPVLESETKIEEIDADFYVINNGTEAEFIASINAILKDCTK